jgi:hypothetical protein
MRNEDGWFAASEVSAIFDELRVPKPSRVGDRLSDLRADRLVVARGHTRSTRWSLTPVGRTRVVDILGELDPAALEAQLGTLPGAELGHARHTVLPPSFAPPRWAAGIAQLLDRFPFETNVLCMTRFPDEEEATEGDPVQGVIDATRGALGHHGLVLHLASDRIVDEDLLGNVAAYMWACQYGIGLFEDRVGERLNYNLGIEVGAMVMAGRRCALLKDTTAPTMPTDLIGRIYKPVNFDDLDAVAREVHLWAAEDLALGRCGVCPPE